MTSLTPRSRWSVRAAVRTLLLAGCLVLIGCTADLQEAAGPIVPIPNVTGLVVRGGNPVDNVKVKLLQTSTDSLIASDRTDPYGQFGFSEVGPGDWTLEVKSTAPEDFARVQIDFVFASAETTYETPALDLSLAGFEVVQPADSETVATPGFSSPLEFRWSLPAGSHQKVQVRLYDEAGASVWYSEKIRDEQVRWNGLGNRGEHVGQFVSPGTYRWKLRVETDESSLESTTQYRGILFTTGVRK